MIFAILILTTFECMGQDSIYFRSIDPWVDTIASIKTIDDTIFKTDKQVLLIKLPNGSFCIINRSDRFIKIKRIDAQLDMVGSEIEINGKWKMLQNVDYSTVSCGNSFWTMELQPKHYISYNFDIPDEPSGREIKIRIFAEYDNRKIYSEPWVTHLYNHQIRQAGKPIQE